MKYVLFSGADAAAALAALLDVRGDGDARHLPLAERSRRASARLADGDAVRLDFLQFRRDMSDAARPRQHAVLPRAVGHARRRDERQEGDARASSSSSFFSLTASPSPSITRTVNDAWYAAGSPGYARYSAPNLAPDVSVAPRACMCAKTAHRRRSESRRGYDQSLAEISPSRSETEGTSTRALGVRSTAVHGSVPESASRFCRFALCGSADLAPQPFAGRGFLGAGAGGAARAPPPPPTTPRPRPGNTAPPTLERGTT